MTVTNRGRFLPRFPTAVTPSGPVTSTQVGLTLTLGADFRPLGAAGGSYDTSSLAIIQDATTGAFFKITAANLLANVQPLDATLSALSGLDASVGLVEQTGTDTFAKRAIGTGASTSVPTTADADARYQGLDATLTALAELNATAGLVEQTGTDTFSKRLIGVANATDIPTRADADARFQPLDADLTALAALSGTNNIYYRSAANTWSSVTIASTLSFTGGSLSAVSATTTAAGVAELATNAETQAQSSATLVVTPSNLASRTAFRAHKNGTAQTGIVTATETLVTFGTASFNTGGYFNTANSRFTPPAGSYRLTARALSSGGAVDQSVYGLIIYKNGAKLVEDYDVWSGTTNATARIDVTDTANGTDYYEIYFVGFGAGNKSLNGAAASTFFCGEAV
jgi:hypothetical protein